MMVSLHTDLENEKNKVAAVVLTFHPQKETVKNVEEILKQVSRVYLVNNEFDESTAGILTELEQHPNLISINFNENKGVAAGFNAGMRKAFKDGFRYVVLFDQDSRPCEGMVAKLLRVYRDKGNNVGIVGPRLRDHTTGLFFDSEVGVCHQDLLISSGSLVSSTLVDQIGYYDESYFIDYVDHEYSLRSKKHGKENYLVSDACLDHQFGDPERKKIFGRSITVSNYAPVRHYYMARNRIFLIKKYGFGEWFWTDFRHFLKMWMKVLLFEHDTRKKFSSFCRGLMDGLRGKKN